MALWIQTVAAGGARSQRSESSPGPAPRSPPQEEPIGAHIVFCWLALVLPRVAENRTGETSLNLGDELQRLPLVTLATDQRTVTRRSLLTPGRQAILPRLDLPQASLLYDFLPRAS